MINSLIQELTDYAISHNLITEDDRIYTVNRLLEALRLDKFEAPSVANIAPRELHLILEDMTSYAIANGLTEDTALMRDLWDTKIMGLVTPAPSVVRTVFDEKYKESSETATDWYYDFSKATNYIRTDRIAKDVSWKASTEYGDIDITINLSKPEKDPRDIAAAGKAVKSGYPLCLLCAENEGYAGGITHPARQNHRIIPIRLAGEDYYLQYSPYVYYNEHCIVFNREHVPMKIDRGTFAKLLEFVTLFPHYTIGSNADLPIVGGSILSHDHFQGGRYEFPMARAPYECMFTIDGYEDIKSGIVRWPLSVIRLSGENPDRICVLSDKILAKWRTYTDEDAYIFAETSGEPHNTITPIARRRGELYELDLVLRNNVTTTEHPMGVYHPHEQYHHIKKENIGLIEVMGLAVLPSRLKKELSLLGEAIVNKADLRADSLLASHADWAEEFMARRVVNAGNVDAVIREEVGVVFTKVLECAGVYKRTAEGMAAFMKFVEGI